MKEKVLKVLQGINDSIIDGVNLMDEGLIDSFELVEIITELEIAFDIEIASEDIVDENFETVDAIVSLVEKKQK